MSKEIFITGATGNIGSHIVKTLQGNGASFTAGLLKKPEKEVDYDYSIMNFAEKKSLIKAFEGVNTIFLLLPIVEPLMTFAKNVIDAAKEVGVKHIVRSSAIQANPESIYMLLAAHGKIDQLLKESGLDYTITQPSSFMQNYVNFLGYSIKSGTVYASTGEGKSGWIDVRDIATANAKILINSSEHKNKVYELTGSHAFPLSEGLQQISTLIDRSIQLFQIPQEAANAKMKEYGMSDKVIEMIASMEVATKDGVLEKVTTNLATIIGQPPISFQTYIEDNKENWL